MCEPKAVYSVGFASPGVGVGVGVGAAADDGADRVGLALVAGFLSAAAAALEVPVDFVANLLVAVVVDRAEAVRGVVDRGVAALAGTVRGLVDEAADGVVGSAFDTSG